MSVAIRDGALEAVIATEAGNQVQSLRVDGVEFLWMPRERGQLGGIPLLAPWANRLDGDAYFANGRRYRLNPDVLDLPRDANGLPIHGFLAFCEGWRVVKQDASSVISRLEFCRNPRWMAQFPFAHTLEITHRLNAGSLEIETAVENHSTEPMPLAIGFHPYFQLTDSPRDQWKLSIPAGRRVILSDRLIPTGETTPADPAQPFPLAGNTLDAAFSGLTGDEFIAQGPSQRMAVRFGPKFPVAIVYAPAGEAFFCFEPMTALTNAFNLHHAGIDAQLQHVEPGETWRESFWIKPRSEKPESRSQNSE